MGRKIYYVLIIFYLMGLSVSPFLSFDGPKNSASLIGYQQLEEINPLPEQTVFSSPDPIDDAAGEPKLSSQINLEKIFYMSRLRRKEGIESLKKNSDKIDILAPQFYEVSAELEFVGGLDEELKKIINEKRIKVMPLIANAGFKQEIMHNFLLSPAAQTKVIKAMVAEAKEQNYIGWQFDFENISYLDRDLYSLLVENTAKIFHENGLILSVAAVTRSVDYEDTDAFKNWSGVFDYERLADAVDFIGLMTYDDPKSSGPVASLPFIERVLNYVKNKIPPEKLSFGIPLYYWSWSADPLKKVAASGTYERLSRIKNNYEYTSSYNKYLGAAWLSYFYEGKQYIIWHQNGQSIENKLDIIKQNNFRGFSAWVLGIENPEIWDAL